MKYIKRHAEKTLDKLTSMFGAVLVTGARQVGKTTLLQESKPKYGYVSLDDVNQLEIAKSDSILFLENNKPPVIIDEIQYAPSLFPEIKIKIDNSKIRGQYLMSGSQQFHLMSNVTESLAGRLGILNLPGLSLRELNGAGSMDQFLPTDSYFNSRNDDSETTGYDAIWDFIFKGHMPIMHAGDDMDKEMFYMAYTKTYIERDVRSLTQVGDENQFAVFMRVLAARTGQMLNLTSVSNEVGISVQTAKRWLSILITSDIVHLLNPFSSNHTKRLVKTPKLYFADTGLASYLTRWPTVDVLKNGAMAGAFFETFVVNEIIKSYQNQGKEAPFFYFRNKDGKEIDLLISEGDRLYPLEIKMKSSINKKDISNFAVLDNFKDYKRMTGGVICLYDKLMKISSNDYVIPAGYL